MKTYFLISQRDYIAFIDAVNYYLERGYELHGDTIIHKWADPEGKQLTYYKQAVIGDKDITFAMEVALRDYDRDGNPKK